MPEYSDDNQPNETVQTVKKEGEQVAFLEDLIRKTDNDKSGMFTSVRADAFLELGLIMFFRKEHNKAIRFIEKAQKHFSSSKNVPQVAACLAELAWIYYNKRSDNLIRSLTLLNDARYLLEHNEHSEVRTKILHFYGLISYREGKFGEAIKYFKKAMKAASAGGLELAKVEDSLAVHYSRVGDFQIAIKYLQSSLKKKKELKHSREQSITEQLLGRLYLRLEDYDQSRYFLEAALTTSKNLGGARRVCRLLSELAKIYLYDGDLNKADQFCKEAIDIAREHDDKVAFAFSYLDYAPVLYEKKEYKEILQLLREEIIPVFTSVNSARGLGFAKRLEARCLLEMNEEHKAIEIFHESMELFKDISFALEVARGHLELSKAYRSISEKRLALSSAREALRIAETEGHNLLIKDVEDEFAAISEEEWFKIIEKRSKHEKVEEEGTSLLDALSTLSHSSVTSTKTDLKDPLISLLHVGQAMAAETDIDRLLITITEETKQALNTDRATVFLLNKDTHELWSIVASGMGKSEIRFPAHMGLAGHVAMTGEVINIEDAYSDTRFNKDIDKKTGYRTRTVLCVPMRNLKHEIIGVFQVINKLDGESFSHEDEALLIAIASSAAISIENARLFKEQAKLYLDQKKSFNSFINTLAFAIDARDRITAGHSSRVTAYTLAIGRQMNLNDVDLEVLEYAAMLHDFGKIGIQDRVLCKEGILTEEEYEEIKRHAFLSKDILEKMYFQEKLKNVPDIASSHHEKYDGTGYFRGTKGEEIPLGGRIMAVADVFDAITSKRHYRDRMPMLKVLNILRKDSGSHFDPKIANVFFEISFAEIVKIIISTDGGKLDETELKLFNKYTVEDVHEIIKKREAEWNGEEKLLVHTFEMHYERRKKQK
jgi:HD-GYP domain-containing protein (c-di-GMP phosphodiesterase class II)/Tfp pilus assembly protein PilF